MVRPAFEARVYLLRTGGVISSLDMSRQSYLHGNEVRYRTVTTYKCEQLDSAVCFDFGSIVFKVIRSRNVYRIVVDKDETSQKIRIWVEGLGVFEGKNLGGRFKQFPAHLKPTSKKARHKKTPKRIAKPARARKVELAAQTAKVQIIENPAFTIAIPIRNKHGSILRNCLRGISLQTIKNIEVIIADYGSSPSSHQKMLATLKQFDCTVYYCPTKEVWSLSMARNIGIRRAKGKHVMTLDGDCVMEPNVVKTIRDALKQHPNSLVISRVCQLPRMNLRKVRLPKDFTEMQKKVERVKPGYGASMTATNKWFRKVRGFDERMKAWGAEDDDLKARAERDGLKVKVIDVSTGNRIYHQWHPRSVPAHKKRVGKEKFQKLFNENIRILRRDKTIIRNDRHWGAVQD